MSTTWQIQILLRLLSLLLLRSLAANLPFVQEGGSPKHAVEDDPPSSSGLSEHIGGYNNEFGSESALTDGMKAHRVGGQGMLHIFHLPSGPSMLQISQHHKRRRSSISGLSRLQQGVNVHDRFPQYAVSSGYVNPLTPAGQEVERLLVSQITPEAIRSYLERITSFPTRSWQNQEASADVQRFLEAEFRGMELPTCPHPFGGGGASTNVVAYLSGSAAGAVVLGAHYDDVPGSGPAPGAEDNGSGLAALLAIASAFKRAKVTPLKSVYFVAFAGEELGLMGSDAFAQELLSSSGALPSECRDKAAGRAGGVGGFLRRVASANSYQAIVMDEVGWRSPTLSEPTVNLESYDWTRDLMETLAQASLTHNGGALRVVHNSNPFGSDHMSFLDRRIPAVLTINGDDEAYPYYHTSADGLSSVSPDLVAQIARMNAGGLLRLCGLQGH